MVVSDWVRERRPDTDLTDHVRCVWRADVGGEPRTLVPDACIDLLWIDNGDMWLCGPETTAWTFALPAGTTAVGVRFRPAAAPSALHLAADEIRNVRIPIDALWGDRAARDLSGRIHDATGQSARVAVLAEAVRTRLADARPIDPVAREVADRLSGPRPDPVRSLARQIGISERQLHRRATTSFGYGPAVLARILRVQRFLADARSAGRPTALAELAIAAGYFDQPHLNRDIRAIAGSTPGAFARVVAMSDPSKTNVVVGIHAGRHDCNCQPIPARR